jgi:flagellar basal body-associated protein FliL
MAKKEADKSTEAATEEVAESPEKIKKKRSLVVVLGVGAVVLAALGAGGFFGYKTFFASKAKLSAKKDPVAEAKEKLEKSEKSGKDSDKSAGHDEDSPNKTGDSEAKKGDDHKKEDSGSAKTDAHGKSDEKSDEKADHKSEEKSDEKSADKSSSEGKKVAEKDTTFGETFEISRMDLNLGNPIENRFLRIGFSLQYFGGEAQKNELKLREPLIKDIVITTVSSRTRVELVTEKGKEKLRREMLNRLNEALDKPVKNVFFTDFLVE